MATSRPRLAIFSPIHPQPSGIADYTLASLNLLKDDFDCSLILDGYQPTEGALPEGVDYLQARDLAEMEWRQQFDLPIYHVGNSPLHTYIYPWLFSWPGITVLHDFWTMGTRMNNALKHWQGDAFRQEMIMAYGEEQGGFAAEIILGGLHHDSFLRYYSMAELPAQASRMTLVHQQWLADHLTQNAPTAHVHTLPHYLEYPMAPTEETRNQVRQLFGYDDEAFVIGLFGGIVPGKQPQLCLNTFAWLRQRWPDARMLIVGGAGHDIDLDGWLAAHPYPADITVTGRVSDEDFFRYLQACDCQLLLRWPTNRESSSVLINSLTFGVPSIITNLAHLAEFPEDCVLRVDADAMEAQLRQQLWRLVQNPGLRSSLSQKGKDYVATAHGMHIAKQTWTAAILEALELQKPAIPQTDLPPHLQLRHC